MPDLANVLYTSDFEWPTKTTKKHFMEHINMISDQVTKFEHFQKKIIQIIIPKNEQHKWCFPW